MASEFGTPLAPQAGIRVTSLPNDAAHVDPYTDPTLTVRNAYNAHIVNTPEPPPSGLTTLGSSRPVYAEDEQEELVTNNTFTPAAPPSNHDGTWRPGYDPYANGGVTAATEGMLTTGVMGADSTPLTLGDFYTD